MPRPRKLDDTKQAQLARLVAAGLSIRNAARLVDCDPRTVRSEVRRNRQFALALKRARSQAQVHPLRTMQQAAANNWRAAAWWLERLAPDTFAQSAAAVLGRREANKFVADLIAIIDQAVSNPVERARLEELLSAAMPAVMRRAWNYRQSTRKLDQAMGYFDAKGALDERLAGEPEDGELACGELVEPLAPDPRMERQIERMLASLGERVVAMDHGEQQAETTDHKAIEQEGAEEAEK